MSFVTKENPNMPQKQRTAICFSTWRESKKKGGKLEDTPKFEGLTERDGELAAKVFVTLDMKDALQSYEELEDSKGKFTLINMVAITEGKWNDLPYPAKAIEEGTPSAEGIQLRLNHSKDVKDAIALVSSPVYNPTLKGTEASAKIYHDEVEPWVLARIKNRTWTDVSAGLHVDIKNDEKKQPYVASMTYDHIGIVTKGACTDAKMAEVLNSAVTELNKKISEVSELEEVEKLKGEIAEKDKALEKAVSEADELKGEKEKLIAEVDKLKKEKEKLEGEADSSDDAEGDDAEGDKGDGSGEGDKDKGDSGDGEGESENAKLKKEIESLKKEVDGLVSIGNRRSKIAPVGDTDPILVENLHIEKGEIYEV